MQFLQALRNQSYAPAGAVTNPIEGTLYSWTFENDLEGWEEANFPYDYDGTFVTGYDEETQSMKVNVDFSKDAEKSYSKAGGVSIWNDDKL